MRAKFRCQSVTTHESGSRFCELYAVHSGSEENKSFAKYTPGANLSITIDPSTDAFNFFTPGKEYYLDFTEAASTPINNNFSVTG